MTSSEWQRHKETHCAVCRWNSKRNPCPAIKWMDLDPNDEPCTRFIRGERCTQWEPRPKRPRKAKKGRSGSERKDKVTC